MRRRTCLQLVGKAPAVFLPGSKLLGTEPLPPSDQDPLPLRGLLPTSEDLPEGYEPAYGIGEGFKGRRLPWGDGRVSANYTERSYTPDEHHDEHSDDLQRSLECRLFLVDEANRSPETLADHHDCTLWDEFDGQEPSLDRYTGWVEADLTESTVAGHRRTTHWRRFPLHYEPDDQDYGDRPVREYAVAIETTDWGVIEVAATANPAEPGRPRDLVETTIATVSERVRSTPTPVAEAERERAERWAEMDTDARDDMVRAVVTAMVYDNDQTVSLDTIVNDLAGRFDIGRETTEAHLRRLERKGVLVRTDDGQYGPT